MASLFGALNTAVSGLTAQSAAFGNISDNIANSQTTGFKGTNTDFVDYLTTSNATTNDSGSVVARPEYQNTVEGTVSASTNPLALAISGQGFFQVSQETGTSGSTDILSSTPEYSRDGDFTVDNNGYLVNGSQQVLNGWLADPTTGVLNEDQIQPIKIDQSPFPPQATSSVTLAANLPATPTAGTPISPQVDVYDAKGTLHVVTLNFTQNASDDWTVSLNAPDATTPALGSADIQFGTASGNGVAAGTVGNITATGGVTATSFTAGSPASLSFTADFGSGPQTINVQLGNYGATGGGLTQFAGTTYQPESLVQNGIPPGNYTGVSTLSSGDVVVNYDNGQTKTIAKVPLVQFANPDALQRENGQGFTATTSSGGPTTQDPAVSGAGSLVSGSIESSNVDIATEFTKLIVAQQAYAANSKVVTTANDMLQTTIDMKR
jgi:flagellar hook protein FlgE